ncbi:Fibronectin type III and SPRY domain-containing protein 1 [Liparis tanakae]|uniref:Fibronectin type III and SPRY domain-containing protein 1 n=1 Tax=Liparis tanakae TaxID=230148 RepID=A0A4Z2ENM3_9TELE|nr:Fibronectin type III and SPRY domain-containing protein 1 [Liparis tanakae]
MELEETSHSGVEESLRKITHTLAMKNEEISNFVCTVKQSLSNLETNTNKVQEDLESEFTGLHAVLDEMKDSMVTRIKQERASRTYDLQVAAAVFYYYYFIVYGLSR